VMQSSIIGDEAYVRERLAKYKAAGINDVMLHPMAKEPKEQLDVLGRAIELAPEG
jgi:hypothetical protein